MTFSALGCPDAPSDSYRTDISLLRLSGSQLPGGPVGSDQTRSQCGAWLPREEAPSAVAVGDQPRSSASCPSVQAFGLDCAVRPPSRRKLAYNRPPAVSVSQFMFRSRFLVRSFKRPLLSTTLTFLVVVRQIEAARYSQK